MRVLLVGATLADNPVGRVHSNWTALRAVGAECRVLVPPAVAPWPPVAADAEFQRAVVTEWEPAFEWADVAVAHKPFHDPFVLCLRAGKRACVPVVLDIDDPDWESRFGATWFSFAKSMAKRISRLQRPPVEEGLARLAIRRAAAVTLSNPALGRWYPPGAVVPHARPAAPSPLPVNRDSEIVVAFVGTPRRHKGLEVLREAVRRVDGVRLIVTAPAPPDAGTREEWVGYTSFEAGRELLSRADVAAVVSDDRISVAAAGQLPAKLIDAMALGRAVLATDLPPIRWAAGGSALLVGEPTASSVADALRSLRDPAERERLGALAHARAIEMFTPEIVGRELLGVCERVVQRRLRSAR